MCYVISMSVSSEVKTWITAYRVHARKSASHLPALLAIVMGSLIVMPGLFSVYVTLFRDRPVSESGLTLPAAIWSLAMFSVFWAVGTRNIPRDIEREVRNGEIETRLVRPVSYLPTLFAQRLGYQRAVALLQGGTVIICAWLFVGFPAIDFSVTWLFFSITLFVVGLAVSLCMFTLIGLTAFWFESTKAFLWVIDRSVMLLGGGLVPVALFPVGVRAFAERSPFGAALSFTQMWNPDFVAHAPHLLTMQLMWLVILSVLVVLVFNQAKRKLSVNGG